MMPRPRSCLAGSVMFGAILVACIAPAMARPAPRQGSARDVYTDIGKVRGPLSDFWIKVRSEWTGYLRRDGGLGPSGGFLQSNLATQPLPGRAWVSLAYSDLTAGGRPTALSHLFEEFLLEYRRAEGRNWPYAQIYDRTWDKLSEMGRKQNLILVGAPWSLPPVGPLAGQLGFTIGHGRIDIGKRRYRGDNLLLLFIAPNPVNAEKYTLVITGTSDEALLQADHLPYGETDYALFRGRRLLESGFFSKNDRRPGEPILAADARPDPVWGPPEAWEARGTHHNFAVRESKHYTFLYEKDRLSPEQLDGLVRAKEAGWPALAALLPVDHDDPPRIVYYLYPSVDRKIDETSRDEAVHLDLAAGEIHTVYSDTQRIIEPWLDAQILLHRTVGPTRVPRLERALAIALAPDFQGRDVDRIAAQVLAGLRGKEGEALKALRDQNVMTPADGPPASHDLLLAGFVKDVVRRHGRDKAFVFLSKASPRKLSATFQDVYGSDLGDALDAWSKDARSAWQAVAAQDVPQRPRTSSQANGTAVSLVARGTQLLHDRDDETARTVLLEALAQDPRQPLALASLARLRFRHGQFDDADADVEKLLVACPHGGALPECAEALAWGRLTRGRIEAVRGRLVAARMDLTHPDVTGAPAPVPTIADYWLETMGFSRNQLTVVSHLKSEARVSLRNLSWREAETDLKKALEIDPTDGEAHRLLSEVYHKEHEYWAWRVRYLNEIQPDYNLLERVYFMNAQGDLSSISRVENLHSLDVFNDLVLRGNVELLKAQSLYAVEIQNLHAEGDRFLIEHKDVEAALKVYRKALELNESFFLSHFLVGRCLFLLDRHDEARASFEQVLQQNPSDPLVIAWTWTYMGYIHLEQEELAEAQRAFDKALGARSEGKVAGMAREGLARVSTIRILLPPGNGRP